MLSLRLGFMQLVLLKNAKARNEWKSPTEEITSSDLKLSLAASLKSDIEAWTGRNERKLIFFLDTFEKLGWVAGEW